MILRPTDEIASLFNFSFFNESDIENGSRFNVCSVTSQPCRPTGTVYLDKIGFCQVKE